MIKTLTLTNWRTHKNNTLDFSNGTNVIVGVMGSGKSSIVNALSYALFGTFPALKSKQVSLSEIIMNKPNPTDFAQTKIIFTKKDKEYLIERKITDGKTNEAKLYENSKLIAGPKQKDVNEKVEFILGLNYELFSRAVYAEQNELDFFLKLSPGERKKKFDELLELEKYENARKNALSLKNSLSKENLQKKEFISQQKENIKSHEEDKIKEKIENELIKEKENLQKKELLEKEILTKKTVLENLEKKEKFYRKINEEINNDKTKLQTLKNSIKHKEIVNLDKLQIEKKELLNKKETYEKEKKNNKSQKEEFEKVRKTIGEENKVLEYKLEQLENEKNEINSLTGTCPTCKQKMDEKHKKEILEKNLLQTNKNKTKKNEVLAKQQELQILVDSFNEKENQIQEKILNLTKEEYEINTKEKNTLELIEIQKTIKEIEENLPNKNKILTENKFDEKEIEKIRKDYFEDKSKIELHKSQINYSKNLRKSYEENLMKINQIKKNIELLQKEFNQSKIASEKLGIFENCLIATQSELRQTMLGAINNAMSQIWESIYPYKDFIDAKIEVTPNGYDLQVKTRNNGWKRVEGILSGGERSAAALCIRIAFALVLTKQLSMLILDEPTHNLDSNAVEKLSTMLRDSLPELVEQIFVITHDRQLENAASSNLYMLNRNKDNDEATKIEILGII